MLFLYCKYCELIFFLGNIFLWKQSVMDAGCNHAIVFTRTFSSEAWFEKTANRCGEFKKATRNRKELPGFYCQTFEIFINKEEDKVEDVVEYEKLLPCRFEQRILACPLVYVPVGSLEWHGEHMALGNDSIKIHSICCEAARHGGGIVFPSVFFGIPYMVNYGSAYRHNANLPVKDSFLRQLLNTSLHSLEKVGFKAAILITGHTPNEQCELVRDIAAEYSGAMKVYGTDDMEWADDIQFSSDHAAKWETSILWYLHPELVDIYRLPRNTDVELESVFGDDPRIYASRDLGKQAVEAITRDLIKKGAELLNL